MNFIYSRIGRKRAGIIAFVLLSTCFIYLLYLPADHFDEGESICISVLLANTECYACGMTRGIQHLIHGDFTRAWEYNKLAFIVLPLSIFMIGNSLFKLIFTEVQAKPNEK